MGARRPTLRRTTVPSSLRDAGPRPARTAAPAHAHHGRRRTWPSSAPAGERSSRTALPTNSMSDASAALTPGGSAVTLTWARAAGGWGRGRGRATAGESLRNPLARRPACHAQRAVARAHWARAHSQALNPPPQKKAPAHPEGRVPLVVCHVLAAPGGAVGARVGQRVGALHKKLAALVQQQAVDHPGGPGWGRAETDRLAAS
jgi:hypothetical protein